MNAIFNGNLFEGFSGYNSPQQAREIEAVSGFGEFYTQWRDTIRVTTSPELTRDLYFQDDRDASGFDLLPDFMKHHGEEWSVAVAANFECRSALAARLDTLDLAKFRMIFERHMSNVARALFDEEYHKSSDERALFLIYHKVPPVRVCSAITRAKNASIDLIVSQSGGTFSHRELGLISAMTTIFTVELNHIMRVYIYFERFNPMQETRFQVVMAGDDEEKLDYSAPTRNAQMSMPDKKVHGSAELF